MARGTVTRIVNLNSDDAWPKFRDALQEVRVDEASAKRAWEQIKSQPAKSTPKPGRSPR
jgi:hypothetical protein